jgi:hypothetical protein
MNAKEFANARRSLGKSQSETANLLGISLRAVQSFEQGWRPVPVHVERQLLFLMAMKRGQMGRPCWAIRECPQELREACPAWEFKAGHICWFITGTICQGAVQGTWKSKIGICRRCEVFNSMFGNQPS